MPLTNPHVLGQNPGSRHYYESGIVEILQSTDSPVTKGRGRLGSRNFLEIPWGLSFSLNICAETIGPHILFVRGDLEELRFEPYLELPSRSWGLYREGDWLMS